MKKILLLIVIPLIVTGCGEKVENNSVNSVDMTTTTSTTVTTTTISTTTTTTKKATSTTKKTTSCKKVFDKKVGTVYESEKKCQSAGNNLFMEADTSKVTNFDCISIKDKCGTTWYYLEWYKFDQKADYGKAE